MKTKLMLTEVSDRKKAIIWINENCNLTLHQAAAIVAAPLPMQISEEIFELGHWVPFCTSCHLKELEAVASEGFLHGRYTMPSPNGFGISVVVEMSDEEKTMVADKIAEIKETNAAFVWLSEQPDDIKRKIEVIRAASVVR